MTVPHIRVSRSESLSRRLGILVAAAGALVLAGWAFDIRLLKQPMATVASMKPNTAASFVFAGCSVVLVLCTGKLKLTSRVLGLLVATIGLLTLSQDVFGWSLGIDELLFKDSNAIATFAPGRMAPASAACLIALGLGLASATSRLVQPAAILAGVLSSLAIVGYLLHVRALYGFRPYTTMAPHTAVLVIALAVALISSRPTTGIGLVLLSDGPGPEMARRLLPAALGMPVVAGWLRYEGQRAGLYGTEVGLALMVVTMAATFSLLIWWNARSLMGAEALRVEAVDKLNVLNATLERRVEEQTADIARREEELRRRAGS